MAEIRKLLTDSEFTKFVDIVANAYTGIIANTPQYLGRKKSLS